MVNVAELKDDYSTFRVATKEHENKTKIPFGVGLGSSLAFFPSAALANGGNAFANIHNAAMNIFDGATLLIIIFAGGVWMLGHRSRAVEMLIGACAGYLIASHAVDIRDFLKTI